MTASPAEGWRGRARLPRLLTPFPREAGCARERYYWHSRAIISCHLASQSRGSHARGAAGRCWRERGGGCEVRVQGRGRNNEGFRERGCQGLRPCAGKAACYGGRGSRGLEKKGKSVQEQRSSQKAACLWQGGSREPQERDGPGWRCSAWKRELGTSRRGQKHDRKHWEFIRIPSLQAHALKLQSGRKT